MLVVTICLLVLDFVGVVVLNTDLRGVWHRMFIIIYLQLVVCCVITL